MTPAMDADGNHKLDWFFNQYVYDTGIAQYTFHATVDATPDGKSQVKGQITRTGVPGNWRDVIPLYVHVGARTVRVGTIVMKHDSEPIDVTLPIKIDRVSINDNQDLLAEIKQ
jgi:hypothetical protein